MYYIDDARTTGQGFFIAQIRQSAQLAISPALLVVLANNQLLESSWLGFFRKERRWKRKWHECSKDCTEMDLEK
jgi:hypothetical protein